VKRLGIPEDFASVFILLATEESPFKTGPVVEADGGYLAQ
jgi:NAD(P)-dependent dehydrogenase (short-subunit alcohol dehydrogenase family)